MKINAEKVGYSDIHYKKYTVLKALPARPFGGKAQLKIRSLF
jgi:hypothetical protein